MAVIRSGASSTDLTVDTASLAARVTIYDTAGNASGSNALPSPVVQKPLPYGALGHYRTAIKLTMATTQAANSNLFEIRNTTTNLLVLTQCYVQVAAAGTITTGYLGEFALRRVTGFTAVDPTNAVAPAASVKRTTGMAAYPGGAAVRYVTASGIAAGMTGGTLVKDATIDLGTLVVPLFTLAATTPVIGRDLADINTGSHPLVMAQNEGMIVENAVVGSGTANVVQVVIDVSWAEVTAF